MNANSQAKTGAMTNTLPATRLYAARPPQGQAGFSLIELMIAATISLLLLAGAAGLFLSNKRIYREQEESAVLQENGRFAMQLLQENIRMAGYVGCSDDVTQLTNNLKDDVKRNGVNLANLYNAADNRTGTLNAIEGIDGGGRAWLPSGSGQNSGRMKPGTDAISVRYLRGQAETLPRAMGNAQDGVSVIAPSGAAPTMADLSEFAHTIAGVADCSGGDVFIVTNAGGGVYRIDGEPVPLINLRHVAGSSRNKTNALSRSYDTQAVISQFIARRFYIGDTDGDATTDDPGLFYTGTNFSEQGYKHVQNELLIEGVEDMQILYGVDMDANSDNIADEFHTAATVPDWNKIVSVRIALLVRTLRENRDIQNTQTYNLLDKTVRMDGDGYRRRVFTTTILIRNRDA